MGAAEAVTAGFTFSGRPNGYLLSVLLYKWAKEAMAFRVRGCSELRFRPNTVIMVRLMVLSLPGTIKSIAASKKEGGFIAADRVKVKACGNTCNAN